MSSFELKRTSIQNKKAKMSFLVLSSLVILASYVSLFNYYCITDVDCCVFTSKRPQASAVPHRVLEAPVLPGLWDWVLHHMVAVPGIPETPRDSPWSSTQFLPPGVRELRFKAQDAQFQEALSSSFWTVQEGTATFHIMSPRQTDPRVISLELLPGQGLTVPRGWFYALQSDGLLADICN